jgi:prepilin-type N-terminal cleavage/methylation domain-containing protein
MKYHLLHRKQAGFTLIELLVVIGIIGTLSALSVSALIRWREANAVYEGRNLFSQDIERTRTYVRRYSTNYRVTIPSTAPIRSYKIEPVNLNGALVLGLPVIERSVGAPNSNFPQNVKLLPASNSFVFTFRSPYGRSGGGADAICVGFQLEQSSTDPLTEVNLVGVTGKVVIRDRNQIVGTTCP